MFWAGGWPLCYYYPYSGHYEYFEPAGYYAPPPVISTETQINYTYYELGLQWGQDLLGSVASFAQFIEYLRTYIRNAPELAQQEFRRGFEAGYGANSQGVFEQAWEQARQD